MGGERIVMGDQNIPHRRANINPSKRKPRRKEEKGEGG